MKLIVLLVLICLVSCKENITKEKRSNLPFLGHQDIEYKTADGREIGDTIFHTIEAFNFLNQDSIQTSSQKFDNKIRVAGFFFTSCPTMCPKMISQMKRLVAMCKDINKEIEFLAFSIDEHTDVPTRLRWYINKNGLKNSNWTFFHGPELLINDFAENSFNVVSKADAAAPGGYTHSAYLGLVDYKGRLRGLYDGQETDEVNKLEKDIRKLIKYESNQN